MKTPLILLPGLLNDKELWAYQEDSLKKISAVHVPDLSRHDSMPDLAKHVLGRAPKHFALAGLSMGGYVALEIMRQAPERVTRLALLDTSARPDTPEQTERRKGLLKLAKAGKFKGVTPRLLPMLIHPDRLKDSHVTDALIEMGERVGRDAFLNQQTAIMHRIDSRPLLPRIACPTLVVVGAQDQLTPPEVAEEMAKAIPGARLAVIDKCGHLPPLEQPDETTKLLWDWLKAKAA